MRLVMSVSTGPGYAPWTLMPRLLNSPRRPRVKECAAAFEAEYPPSPGMLTSETTASTFTIAPFLLASSAGTNARVTWRVPK